MDFPIVTVLVCTYNRPAELIRTLTALHENLIYPAESLRYLICDDATPGYLAKLKTKAIWKTLKPTFISTEQNGGWGVNVNNGLAHVDTDYVFFIEDDYEARTAINLGAGVAIMQEKPHVGMMRYRGTAGDHLVYHQFEADISAYYPDYQDGVGLPGKAAFLQLDSGSPSLYIYSHGAHLKHKRFHEFYGPYPTGLKLGETEEAYAHVVKDGMKQPGAPGIAIMPDYIPMWFDHIGQSYQHTEADK